MGRDETWSILVTNPGTEVADGVAIRATLPAGVSFRAATTTRGTTIRRRGTTIIITAQALAPGAAIRVHLRVRPTVARAVVGSVRVSSRSNDVDLSNNIAEVWMLVVPAPRRSRLVRLGRTLTSNPTMSSASPSRLTS